MSQSVLILGATGRLGQSLAQAFLAAGWRVKGHARKIPAGGAKIQWITNPLDDPAELVEAAGPADVVVHAVNPVYTRWQREARPLLDAGIAIARRLDALLMFPGNVYNFGEAMPESLAETVTMQPTTRKGEIRCDMENTLLSATQHGLRAVILRAGDFFGGPGRGAWFDIAIAKSLNHGRVTYPGAVDAEHAWAYLPDLAQAFVMVAERRNLLQPFQIFHFPGYAVTGERFIAALTQAALQRDWIAPDAALKRTGFPWSLIRLGGWVIPMWRELAEMRYLWERPHRLDGARLTEFLGELRQTPLDSAVDMAVTELFGQAIAGAGKARAG